MSTVTSYVVEANGCEWSHAVAACSSRREAQQWIRDAITYHARAPVVDYDSADWEAQHAKRERYARRGPGGEEAGRAEGFSISRVKAFGLIPAARAARAKRGRTGR